MIRLAEIAAWSFAVGLSGALAPGPVLAVTIAGTRHKGFWFGPLVVVGHALVELPIVLVLVWGMAAVLGSPWVLMGVGTVGSAAMVWMGIGLLRQSRRPTQADPEAGVLRIGAVGSGALTSALNPYWYFWWATVGALMVASAQAAGWPGVAVFFAGHISADLAWYTLISLGVAKGRRLLEGRLYRALLIVCGVILLVMAARFVYLAAAEGLKAASG